MTEEKIELRSLEIEEIDELLEIERVSFPTPWSREAFLSELLQNTLAHYFGCWRGDKLIGYAGMWLIIDEAHITNVAVHPDFRNQKVGEMIMRYLIATALSKGAFKMTLEVRPSNFSAQALYKRLGFESVGRRKGYYTDTNEDAIIMWMDLDKTQAEA